MSSKLLKPLAAAAFAASLWLPQAALAATAVDASPSATAPHQVTSPSTAVAPAADGWTEIQPGEYQWFTFKYDYDTTNRPAEISMYAQPNASVDLMLLNGEQVHSWQHGGDREHFGEATTVTNRAVDTSVHHAYHAHSSRNYDYSKKDAPTRMEKGDYAVWSGLIGNSGTFYIVAHRDAHANGPAYYRFTMNGDGVTSLQQLN